MNFFKNLFRCFGPGSAYIVPAVEAGDDSKGDAKFGRGVRQKSQLEAGNSPDTEDDCLLLIGMIQVDENDRIGNYFTDPSNALIFSFVDHTLSSAFRTPVGKSSNSISIFRMLLGKTILRDINELNTEQDTKALINAITSFLDSIERCRIHIDGKLKTLLNAKTLSCEGFIIILDLLLLAVHDYVANIGRKSATLLSGEVLSCFEQLCKSLEKFCSLVDDVSSNRMKLLLCQCTARASKIICSVGCYGNVSEVLDVTVEDRITHMSSALQAISSSVVAIRTFCETRSQSVSMVFWSACEALSYMVERSLQLKRVGESPRAVAAGQQVFNALWLTAPVPNDLYAEIKYLQSVELSVLSLYENASRASDTLTLSLSRSDKIPPKITPGDHRYTFKLQYLIDGLQVMLRAGVLDSKRNKQSERDARRARERWMLSTAECLFFVLDQSTPIGTGTGTPSNNNGNGTISGGNSTIGRSGSMSSYTGVDRRDSGPGFPSPSSSVTPLAPILAAVFLDIMLSYSTNTSEDFQNIQWTFWELAKRLASFAERLRRGKRSLAIFTKRVSRLSSEQPLSPNSQSHSHSHPHTRSNSNSTSNSIPLPRNADSFNTSSRAKLQLQLQLSNIRQQDALFSVGDAVDGLWILGNGTQRWYPGRISLVGADGTYSVEYMDGDVHEGKHFSEIRHSKNSKLSTARSNKNLHSDRGSQRDADKERLRDKGGESNQQQGTSRDLTIDCMGVTLIPSPNVESSRNSSIDSPHFFSFCSTGEAQSDSQHPFLNADSRPSLYKRPSSRSVSSTPCLAGLKERENSFNRSLKDSKFGPVQVPSLILETGCRSAEGSRPSLRSSAARVTKRDTPFIKSVKTARIDSGVRVHDTADFSTCVSKELERLSESVPTLEPSPRAAPFLGQPQVHRRSSKSEDSGCSADSAESDGQTFAIPSVFPTPRSERKVDALVPRIQFSNLELGSSAAMGAGMSLSAAICQEGGLLQDDDSDDESYRDLQMETARSTNLNSQCQTVFNSLPESAIPSAMVSPRSRILQSLNSPTAAARDEFGDNSTSHKLLTWRDQPVGQRSAYQMGRGDGNEPAEFSNIGSGATSRQDSFSFVSGLHGSNSSRYLKSHRNSPYSSFKEGTGEVRGTARSAYLRGTGYDENTLAVLIRTFSIISASLLQRCVVGEGSFLDITTCSTHEADSSSSLLAKRRRNSDYGTEELSITRPLTTSLKSQSCVGPRVLMVDTEITPSPSPLLCVSAMRRTARKASSQRKQINMLFSIREFLESIPDSEQSNIIPILTEISNFSLGASMRILKLVSPYMFNSCLPSHMDHAEKVGTGGFGTVFKVTCDASCGECPGSHSLSLPLSLGAKNSSYQLHNSRSSSGRRSTLMNAVTNDNGSTSTRTVYAVKRISRERSVYDSPIIYEIFNEITSLELLAGNKGVCELLDFGVHGIEYWMIMEAGKMDLLAWRNTPATHTHKRRTPSFYSPSADCRSFEGVSPGGVNVDVPFTGSGADWNMDQSQRKRLSALSDLNLDLNLDLDTCDECQTDEELPSGGGGDGDGDRDPDYSEKDPLTLHKLAVCLALFADALLIVQSVHSSRVLHFDIKCANFILRCEPDLDVMYRAHEKGDPSGYIFLADFGESVPSLVSYSPNAQRMAERLLTQKGVGSPVTGRDSLFPGDGVGGFMSHVVEGGPSTASRSRGTLAIQSPEMLCLTAKTEGAAKNLNITRPFSTPIPAPTPMIGRCPSADVVGSEFDGAPGAVELQAQALTRIQSETRVSRKAFPPPSASSDVWSLGCLLVELVSGQYLMADRPWTDLYVSLCMMKFQSPSLDALRRSVELVTSIDFSLRLEGIVGKCMVQDPRQRAKIVDVFEDVMTLIIDHGHLADCASTSTPKTSSTCSQDKSTACTTGTSNSVVPSLEPRSVSTVLSSMKAFLSSRQVTRWSIFKTVNILHWSRDTSKLRPRSLDFRCGSGLVITLLGSNHSSRTAPTAPSTCIDRRGKKVQAISTNASKCADYARVPYLSPALHCIDYTEDLTAVLRARIDTSTRTIQAASLATCAKTLTQKSVVNSVRDDGVFHVEISCGSQGCFGGGTVARKHHQLRGIERLVLPIPGMGYGDAPDEDSEGNCLDELFSDTAIVKAVERLMQLAQSTLSVSVPPTVLITVVPYATAPTGGSDQYIGSLHRASSGHYGDPSFMERKEDERSEFQEEEADSTTCVYSRVALTVAITLADFFAKVLSVGESDKIPSSTSHNLTPLKVTQGSGSGQGTGTGINMGIDLSVDSTRGGHLMPRGTSETRRNSFKVNKAACIMQQSKKQTRRRSLAVSQSLYAVAPWLRKALHLECQTFLAERLNLPTTV